MCGGVACVCVGKERVLCVERERERESAVCMRVCERENGVYVCVWIDVIGGCVG